MLPRIYFLETLTCRWLLKSLPYGSFTGNWIWILLPPFSLYLQESTQEKPLRTKLPLQVLQGHFSLPSFSLYLFSMLLFSFLKSWTVCLFTLDRSSSWWRVHLWRISYCSWLDCHSCALHCIISVIIYLIDNVVPTYANLPEKDKSQIIQAINQV